MNVHHTNSELCSVALNAVVCSPTRRSATIRLACPTSRTHIVSVNCASAGQGECLPETQSAAHPQTVTGDAPRAAHMKNRLEAHLDKPLYTQGEGESVLNLCDSGSVVGGYVRTCVTVCL